MALRRLDQKFFQLFEKAVPETGEFKKSCILKKYNVLPNRH